MCGFYGVCGGNVRNVEQGLAKIQHRGPDEQNIVQFESTIIGHVRLSIVGLDSGHQPAKVKDGYLVFNGEIYNFRSLITKFKLNQELESDTDVLVALFNAIGWNRLLNEIQGMFSIALVFKDEVLLARDRFGQKPLYYSKDGNVFQFGSDLLSFNVNRSLSNLNSVAINHFMSFAFIPAPYTIWNSVFKVEPGQYVRYNLTSGEISKEYYYNLFYGKFYSKSSYSELLKESVLKHSISDVGSNLLLSGGVDSSLLALYADSKTEFFTVRWNDKEYNESYNALSIADFLTRKLNVIEVEPTKFEPDLQDIVNILGEPFADDGILSLDAVLKSVKSKGEKVVLSGDAADEIFGGYNRYNIDLYLRFIPKCIIKFTLKFFNVDSLRYTQLKKLLDLKNATCPFDRHYRISQVVLNDIDREKIVYNFENIASDIKDKMKQIKINSSVNWKHIFDLGFLIEGNMMVKGDRISMKNSLELRVPFLDEFIVEKALLTTKKHIRWGVKKFELKKIFILNFGLKRLQKKMGFGTPLLTDFGAEYRESIARMLENENLLLWRVVDRNETLKLLSVNAGNYKRLSFALLVLSIWLETHVNDRALKC